ncbi:MAG: hypothetical protein ACM3OC_09180 [Deltaproteobacteria bacterium]
MKNTIDLVRPFDLKELVDKQQDPCVSLYMSTHKKSDQKQQDPLRLKDLIRDAEHRLTGWGVRLPEARQFMAPLTSLIKEYGFWEHQSEGLAAFISPLTSTFYHLPYRFPDTVSVGPHFHFKPLLPMLSEDGVFYILALSPHEVRLFQANRFETGEINLEGMVPDRAQHMKLHHDLDRRFEFQTRGGGAPTRTGSRELPFFFGQGASCDCRKEDILQFFHAVNRGVMGMIREDHRPMVLAGSEGIVHLYRKASHYPYLCEDWLPGNQDITDELQLQRMAWPLVEPVFARSRSHAEDAYKDLTGTLRRDNRIREILPASHEGLIETLFVPLDRHQWGKFDGSRETMELHAAEQPGDDDLLDLAALLTKLHKGAVYALPQQEMPGDGILNAIYRF